jgi:hypothetical protein
MSAHKTGTAAKPAARGIRILLAAAIGIDPMKLIGDQ